MSNKLHIEGLNPLDAEELKAAINNNGLELFQPEAPEGTIAEPATITAILTLGAFTAVDLATWISKGRRRRVLKRSVKIAHPDGRIEERQWEVDESSED